MLVEDLTIDQKVERLYDHIERLNRRIADLEERLAATGPVRTTAGAAVATGTALLQTSPVSQGAPGEERRAGGEDTLSDEVIGWASRASLFPRLAALCFLMAVALILRTITDNGMVHPLVGMGLGMGYAAALMAAGWHQYRRGSALAPVFVACGAILLPSIVVETHERFRWLPLVPAYWTLMITGAGAAFISRRFKAFLPVSVGTLGMCLAGAAIDYPNPFFPYLFMILLTANLLGYYAGTLQRCGWLRWTVLFVTLAMFLLWGMRLEAVASGKITAAPTLAPAWFLPVLAVVSVVFPGIALLGIIRSRREHVSAFDYCLPTINAVGSYLAARVVASEADGTALALSLVAILFALLHFGAAFWLATRKVEGTAGINSFVIAGSALLALAVPAAVGSTLAGAPLLGAAALGVAALSGRWRSGGVRALSYALQAYAGASLALHFLAGDVATGLFAASAGTAASAAAAMAHYRWCRRNDPPADSPLFATYDTRDLGGTVPLLVALSGSFFLLRGIAWSILPGGPAGHDAFQCAQGIIINLAALGLGLYAFRTRNRELRNVAILVIAAGAVTSTSNLLGTKGLPLVLSVFSFGLAAATQSVALSRWQKSSQVVSSAPPASGSEAAPAVAE